MGQDILHVLVGEEKLIHSLRGGGGLLSWQALFIIDQEELDPNPTETKRRTSELL